MSGLEPARCLLICLGAPSQLSQQRGYTYRYTRSICTSRLLSASTANADANAGHELELSTACRQAEQRYLKNSLRTELDLSWTLSVHDLPIREESIRRGGEKLMMACEAFCRPDNGVPAKTPTTQPHRSAAGLQATVPCSKTARNILQQGLH